MRRRTFCGAAASMLAGFAGTRPIRVAMIGTAHGHAASKAKAFRVLPMYDLVGVCRVHADEPDTHEAFHGVNWISVERVLDDPSIEVVAIETRPERNFAYAERAVAAGKYVHLDKPPGNADLGRFRKLLSEAARRGRVVQMGYQWRYHPAMMLAIEAARKGWLGSVYSLRAAIDKPLTAEERLHLGKFPGGIMFDEGCHLIDRAIDVFGKPQRVTGYLQRVGKDGLADNTRAMLEYEGALAEISMSGLQPNGNKYRVFELSGTNGKALVQPYAPLRLMVDLKVAAGPYQAGEQVVEPPEAPGPAYAPDFVELARVIRDNAKPAYSAEHDVTVQETLLRASGMVG